MRIVKYNPTKEEAEIEGIKINGVLKIAKNIIERRPKLEV